MITARADILRVLKRKPRTNTALAKALGVPVGLGILLDQMMRDGEIERRRDFRWAIPGQAPNFATCSQDQRARVIEAVQKGACNSRTVAHATGLSVAIASSWLSKLRLDGVLDWIGQERTGGPNRPINRYALHDPARNAPPPVQASAPAARSNPAWPTITVEGVEYEVHFSGAQSLTPNGFGLGSSLSGSSYRVARRPLRAEA